MRAPVVLSLVVPLAVVAIVGFLRGSHVGLSALFVALAIGALEVVAIIPRRIDNAARAQSLNQEVLDGDPANRVMEEADVNAFETERDRRSTN